MLSNRLKFLKSESGSIAPIFALSLLPLLLAVGLSVDYTSATTTKADMQSALDAASLSIVTMPRDTSRPDRETALQAAFLGNGGEGTATLDAFSIAADGAVNLQASATYAMPTNFMQLAMVNAVPLGVQASVNKTPALVEATFKIDKISGYWSKTMTLYGTKFSETNAKKLLEIKYTYNGAGGLKGFGTTEVIKLDDNGNKTTIQTQTCESKAKGNGKVPSGWVTDGNNIVKCTMSGDAGGAVIDVSNMNSLYLQMKVPDAAQARPPQPTDLRSDDPNTSDHLFIGNPDIQAGKMLQVANGKSVDIFTAVPCGKTSNQAWEDGGTIPLSPDFKEADFFYNVTGKCDFNKRPSETVLTQ